MLFGPPAHAYVYLSYGIHSLLNFVCEPDGDAAAVLIRALEPTQGIDEMRRRRGVERVEDLCSGPGQADAGARHRAGAERRPLEGGPIRVSPRSDDWSDPAIVTGPRIGITKAVEHPWRFCVAGSRFVSRRGRAVKLPA